MAVDFGEDMFQRIVGVHWPKKEEVGGGGIVDFVAVIATQKGEVFRVNFARGSEPELEAVPILGIDIYSIVGCECAVLDGITTFVLAGSELIKVGGTAGFIFSSYDGLSWQQVFQTPQGSEPTGGGFSLPWAGTVSAIVYSDVRNVFAASCIMIRYDQLSEEIYTSGDSLGWSLVSSISINGLEQIRSEASLFPANYCSHNQDCKDDFQRNVPGGIMRNDIENGIQMSPVIPPTVYYWSNAIPGNIDYHTLPLRVPPSFEEPVGRQPSQNVMVEISGPSNSATIPGLAIVTCVAGNGGIWLAGGFVTTEEESEGAVALTTDSGKNWQLLGGTASGVVGIAVSKGPPVGPAGA